MLSQIPELRPRRGVAGQLGRGSVEGGYAPHIDDGVAAGAAPLRELLPSWGPGPREAWAALERGDLDWSRQAMDRWPDRVRAKCRGDRSLAIAHSK